MLLSMLAVVGFPRERYEGFCELFSVQVLMLSCRSGWLCSPPTENVELVTP